MGHLDLDGYNQIHLNVLHFEAVGILKHCPCPFMLAMPTSHLINFSLPNIDPIALLPPRPLSHHQGGLDSRLLRQYFGMTPFSCSLCGILFSSINHSRIRIAPSSTLDTLTKFSISRKQKSYPRWMEVNLFLLLANRQSVTGTTKVH